MGKKSSKIDSKRWGRPARRAVRYLVTQETLSGFRYYWTPPSRDRGKTPWLKNTPLGSDLRAAIVEAEKLNAKIDRWRGTRIRDGISSMIAEYLASPEFRSLKDRTKSDYNAHLAKIAEDFKGSEPTDVTEPVVWMYRDALTRVGLSDRQIRYRMQVLSILFSYGVKRGLCPLNPATKMKLSAKRTTEPRIWTLSEINEAMDKPYPIGLAAGLALFTLQRQGDILGMRRSHIKDGVLRVTQNKTAARVFVPVHEHLADLIEAAPKTDLLVATKRGAPYTESGFRSVWAKSIDPERPTFHEIRATATSWLKQAGISDSDTMILTGHKRTGEGAILDVYDRRIREVRNLVFPVMDGWRVQGLDKKGFVSD